MYLSVSFPERKDFLSAYRPRQTCSENLPWQRHTTHLIEIKYCEDTLESRLSTLATCGFGVRTSLEATTS